jgi:hypothetical protein
LRSAFIQWQASAESAQSNSLQAEAASVAKELAVAASIGLQILDQMESGKSVSENWISEKKQILDKLDRPIAEVRLAAVRPVRILLDELTAKSAVSH